MQNLIAAALRRRNHKRRVFAARRLGSAGSVALIFALCLFTVIITVGVALDFSRLADGRAALQRAADNAALTGAAAYAEGGSYYQSLSLVAATAAFCNQAGTIPEGFNLVGSGTSNGQTAESCATPAAGPSVSAVTSSYTPGTPYTPTGATDPNCVTTIPGNVTYTCAFVVTVTATATMSTSIPALLGISKTISVTASAANPFINFAKVFSGTTIASNAKYANSVWVYPLLLNAQGQPDYTTPGALPDATTCLAGNGPDATTCGAGAAEGGSAYTGFTPAVTTSANYVMLANTEYANTAIGSAPFTSPLSGVTYVGGVVQNPPTPPGVTATTPLGVAFQSIAGGNLFYASKTELINTPSGPGVYGYMVSNLGASTPQYVTAPSGCAFPYDNLAYQTLTQDWQTNATGTSVSPLLPWANVTHWFYSSYLAAPTPLPPSEMEVASQLSQPVGNETVPSIPQDAAQTGGNIGGKSTYNASPSPAVPTSASACPPTTTKSGQTYSNTTSQTSTYPTLSTADNCSVFVAQSTTSGLPATPQYDGACFNPATTPGHQWAALSCQAYGAQYYYTFFWNDMGGYATDNLNYEANATNASGDGTVQLHCASGTHIVLIN